MDKNVVNSLNDVFTYGDMVEMFTQRASSQVRRRVEYTDAKKVISKIFSYIVLFNSLSEDTTMFNEHPLTDWPVLNEFKDFIYPNSIRWKAGDKSYQDVLNRVFELKDKDGKSLYQLKCVDYNDYLNALSEFRSFFKKDATSDYVSLASLRVDRAIADVCDFITLNSGKCHFESNPYVPVIKVTLPDEMLETLVKGWYFNSTLREVYGSYLAKLFF